MREILFRGKQTATLWVYGSLFVHKEMYAILDDNCIKNGMFHPICVVPKTVSQFTGLTDKNGKKIFEGDVLKDDWGKKYKVIFTTNSCGFMADCTVAPNEFETGRYRLGKAWSDTISVIGNIHDNPELLEKGGT